MRIFVLTQLYFVVNDLQMLDSTLLTRCGRIIKSSLVGASCAGLRFFSWDSVWRSFQ